MLYRMLRAATLDAGLYAELERDRGANIQAVAVVLLAGAALAAGDTLATELLDPHPGGSLLLAALRGLIQGIFGWMILSYVTYLVGAHIFGSKASYGRVVRSVGFAYSPAVLYILSFLRVSPSLGLVTSSVVGIWILGTTLLAAREGLELTSGAAALAVSAGLIAAGVSLAVVERLAGLL